MHRWYFRPETAAKVIGWVDSFNLQDATRKATLQFAAGPLVFAYSERLRYAKKVDSTDAPNLYAQYLRELLIREFSISDDSSMRALGAKTMRDATFAAVVKAFGKFAGQSDESIRLAVKNLCLRGCPLNL